MAEKKSVGFGITGFILGILSILFAGYLGGILAIVGFVFCLIQRKKNPTKLATAGIILNVIGVVLSILFITVISSYMNKILMQQGV